MDPALMTPIAYVPGDRVTWYADGIPQVRIGTVVAVAESPDGPLARILGDALPWEARHAKHTTHVLCSRLSLLPPEPDSERDQAFAALRAIYAEFIRYRSGGDEWASEFLGESWSHLVPASLRALLDIGPDETEDETAG